MKRIGVGLIVLLLAGCGGRTVSGEQLASEVKDLLEGTGGVVYSDWQVDCEDAEVTKGTVADCKVTASNDILHREAQFETLRVEFLDEEGHFEFTSFFDTETTLEGKV